MACRDNNRATASKSDILQEVPDAEVKIMHLDLADFASIRNFSAKLTSELDLASLSLLVNNAGTNARPHSMTADGHETIFQTNYLGHFLLTKELFPLLIADGNARIVTVTSYYHHSGAIDFNNLESENGYDYFSAYANSKLEEIMFSFELQRRIQAADLPLFSVAVHPGSAKSTMLYRYPTQDARHWFIKKGESIFGQSPKGGTKLPFQKKKEDLNYLWQAKFQFSFRD
jgi:NAD(P)-dependent dehydrogenase (short-subunit alcohol dehydrogenase family)